MLEGSGRVEEEIRGGGRDEGRRGKEEIGYFIRGERGGAEAGGKPSCEGKRG